MSFDSGSGKLLVCYNLLGDYASKSQALVSINGKVEYLCSFIREGGYLCQQPLHFKYVICINVCPSTSLVFNIMYADLILHE